MRGIAKEKKTWTLNSSLILLRSESHLRFSASFPRFIWLCLVNTRLRAVFPMKTEDLFGWASPPRQLGSSLVSAAVSKWEIGFWKSLEVSLNENSVMQGPPSPSWLHKTGYNNLYRYTLVTKYNIQCLCTYSHISCIWFGNPFEWGDSIKMLGIGRTDIEQWH